jgi:hypothetical protein
MTDLSAALERGARAWNFEPVRTKADLDTLNEADIVEGYLSAERGDPEPGPNRGRAYWHGWRNRMIDYGVFPPDAASQQLVGEVLAHNRAMRDELVKEMEK